MTGTGSSKKVALVTGHITVDWSIARTPDPHAARTQSSSLARASWQRGGAARLGDLIEAIGGQLPEEAKGTWLVKRIEEPRGSISPDDRRYHQTFAIWSPYDHSSKSGPRRSAWRVAEFIGSDPGSDGAALSRCEADPETVDLIVIDDADLGFRGRPDVWPEAVKRPSPRCWAVLRMSRPIAAGALWEHLRNTFQGRLIAIMHVDDLRRTEVQISRELSWERTAQDLAWEIMHNPRVNALSSCAHVVVSFDGAGAFLLSRTAAEVGAPAAKYFLFFDPEVIEGMWAHDHFGGMVGYDTCLTAAIARELMIDPANRQIQRGIQAGLAAVTRLHLDGYVSRAEGHEGTQLEFPIEQIAREIGADAPNYAVVEVQDPVRFITQRQPTAPHTSDTSFWTILEDRHPDSLDQVAQRVVLEGVERALLDVPHGRFGNLLTVDRHEIESFRSIRALVGEYCSQSRQKRPISIAVFGSPGSGKSFGIGEVARSLLPGVIKRLEFNLSQIEDVDELHQALHQVRDAGLSGSMPLVFWDEFDTALQGQPLGWLRHFLAPMQDGVFQEGQVVHPIGPAIFVFAGGTCERMESFGHGLTEEQFRAAKGPDFVSRLKGHVTVMGPNPVGGDASSDPHHIIRRAILLRSMLSRQSPQLVEKKSGLELLRIDAGVLRAYLQVSRYRHGARSMESIVMMSQLSGKACYERSCLPPEDQLNLHVNGLEFLSLVQQIVLTEELLERLAAAAHDVFCDGKVRDGWRYGETKSEQAKTHPLLIPYDQLPELAKESNRVTVRAIPLKLSMAGYAMLPSRSNQPPLEFPGDDLEKLAQIEHQLWMDAKLAAGFKLGKPTPDDPKRNEYLVEWDQLSDAIKQIDRDMIRGIPRILARTGYAVERVKR
ncbi:MAG: RyR domain-containing protein [Acidobacteriota bacterium]